MIPFQNKQGQCMVAGYCPFAKANGKGYCFEGEIIFTEQYPLLAGFSR